MEGLPLSLEHGYLEDLEAEMDVLINAILNGSCADYSKYMWYTGQLQGLRVAKRTFKERVDSWKEQ